MNRLPVEPFALTSEEFSLFQTWLHSKAGIKLSPEKKALICGRLNRRLREKNFTRYIDYFRLITSPTGIEEAEIALNLLTTNETYFFREPKHFDFLRKQLQPGGDLHKSCRIWSAACSTGEEPYTMAMVLAEAKGNSPWEIFASDINSSVLAQAAQGCFALERGSAIPPEYLRKYCLRGIRSQAGSFLVDRWLRERVRFARVNLNETLPRVDEFDVIFLRNVLIYFDVATKDKVIDRLLQQLRPGGYFVVGHSESIHGKNNVLSLCGSTVYQKKGHS